MKICLAFLLHCCGTWVQAQQPVWVNYTSADGLPSNEVYQVHQDKRGFIWFCTDGGVSCFDGKTFRNFNSENGFPDNTVLGLYEDKKGNLWFRTLTGRIVCINTETYELSIIEARIEEYFLNSLFVDDDEVIWASASSATKFYKIWPPYQPENIQSFSDTSASIHLYKHDNGGFTYYRSRNFGMQNMAIHSDNKTQILQFNDIKTSLKLMNFESHTFITTPSSNWMISNDSIVTSFEVDGKISNTTIDSNNNLWLCLLGSRGVLFYENIDVTKKPIRYFEGIGVSSVLQDDEGNFWITSTTNGVFFVSSFDILTYKSTLANLSNKVTGVFCTNDGTVIGKNYDVTYFQVQENEKVSDKMDKIVSFKYDHSFRSHFFETIVTQRVDNDEYYPSTEVFRLRGKTGFWTASGRAISQTDENYNVTDRYIPSTRISSYCIEDSTKLWLACLDGLWSFQNEKYTSHTAENELLQMRFDDVQLSDKGEIWLCSRIGGVVVKKGNDFINITIKNGLASDICRSIFVDRNIVWVGTNRGISKIIWNAWNNYSIENYSLEHGLPSAEINMIDKSGNRIWVASDAGIFSFREDYAFNNNAAPRIYIKQMLVNENAVSITSNLVMKANENFIRISLVGLSFKYPKANSFKYQLLGLDTTWTTTSSNEIVFTTLPPGQYIFSAFAMNNNGVPSDKPVVLEFNIAKPYWMQWWFIGLFVLAFGAFIYWFVQKRIISIQHKAEEKTALAKNIAELEMRALRTQMNPHFIFNCINSIQHFILSNDKMEAQKQLSRFAKLIRNVLENSKQDLIPLQTEMETLELYIQMESLRFEKKFVSEIHIDNAIDKMSTMLPPMLIQPFVENAIVHGLLALNDRNGKLSINVEKNSEVILVTIDDNGIGRKASAIIKKRKGIERSSLGISITQERLVIMNKTGFGFNSISLKITDKMNDQGVSLGTSVEIMIPFQKA